MPFFDPVTKQNVSVERVDRIPDLLRQAFREATTESPRPVHLDIQTEAADQEAGCCRRKNRCGGAARPCLDAEGC